MQSRTCLLTAAVLLAPGAAVAGVPGPVCGTPQVLEIVARMLIERGPPAVIVAPPVGEVPTDRPDTVLCAARVQREVFDTNHFGAIPQYREQTYKYTVRYGFNGLFVTAEGG